jgi:opacity protein-like surface antigen
VPSVYAFLVEDDGTEIEQDLRLRVVPFSATVRLLPFGRDTAIQPYVGAGIAVLSWRYSEVGEFVDFDGLVFQGRFVETGTDTGPLVLVGARFPAGNWTVGGEVRYQRAEGELPADEFLGSSIDLGGFNYLLTFTARF